MPEFWGYDEDSISVRFAPEPAHQRHRSRHHARGAHTVTPRDLSHDFAYTCPASALRAHDHLFDKKVNRQRQLQDILCLMSREADERIRACQANALRMVVPAPRGLQIEHPTTDPTWDLISRTPPLGNYVADLDTSASSLIYKGEVSRYADAKDELARPLLLAEDDDMKTSAVTDGWTLVDAEDPLTQVSVKIATLSLLPNSALACGLA